MPRSRPLSNKDIRLLLEHGHNVSRRRTPEEEHDLKMELRTIKNKLSARECRERKKKWCIVMQRKKAESDARIELLQEENKALKERIRELEISHRISGSIFDEAYLFSVQSSLQEEEKGPLAKGESRDVTSRTYLDAELDAELDLHVKTRAPLDEARSQSAVSPAHPGVDRASGLNQTRTELDLHTKTGAPLDEKKDQIDDSPDHLEIDWGLELDHAVLSDLSKSVMSDISLP